MRWMNMNEARTDSEGLSIFGRVSPDTPTGEFYSRAMYILAKNIWSSNLTLIPKVFEIFGTVRYYITKFFKFFIIIRRKNTFLNLFEHCGSLERKLFKRGNCFLLVKRSQARLL